MAWPHEVPHGSFHAKLVRVYPERYDATNDLEWINRMLADHGKPPTTPEVLLKNTIEGAREKGYVSGTIAKVVMVSRMGDCGLTRNLRAEFGYDMRLAPECLEIVSDEEAPRLLHQWDMGRLNGDHGPKKKLTLAEKRRRKA